MIQILLVVIYIAFISLGLPDSLLGSAWPAMHLQFNVPVSYAGIISMIIALGTVFSSLQSDRLTKKWGTGVVTAASVALTAAALLGFSASHSFTHLVLWAIPYGLGAGSIDASLNNYVAIHYKSRHMSWLHCMWDVGASVGPYIMGYALALGKQWNAGYQYVGILQVALTAILLFSLPLWKKSAGEAARAHANANGANENYSVSTVDADSTADTSNGIAADNRQQSRVPQPQALSLKEIGNLPGAKAVMVMFFCYCALEQTTGLWASSFLVSAGFSIETATRFASLFFIGITAGRAISGFITFKLNDRHMIHLGQLIICVGIILLLIKANSTQLAGFICIGLGCAPIYPSIIYATPHYFGADKSQAVIGVQMASAYVGTCSMPPLFGVLAQKISLSLLPIFLAILLVLMVVMHKQLDAQTRHEPQSPGTGSNS